MPLKVRQDRGLMLDPAAQSLMGSHEVAAYLGITTQAVSIALRKRKKRKFPKPVAHLRCGPVWRTSTIVKYVEKRAVTSGNRR